MITSRREEKNKMKMEKDDGQCPFFLLIVLWLSLVLCWSRCPAAVFVDVRKVSFIYIRTYAI